MIEKLIIKVKTLHSLHTIDVAPGEIGVTVRRGTKWTDALIGEKLNLCVCLNGQHNQVGQAEVVGNWVGKFCDIRAKDIEDEHELSSRLYSGLLTSMRRAYGSFDENEEVVVLKYKRIS